MNQGTYLLLTKIVWKVGNHDLGLGWDTVFGGAALLTGTKSIRLARLAGVDSGGSLLARGSAESLVGGFGQWQDLAWNVGWAVGGFAVLCVRLAGLVLDGEFNLGRQSEDSTYTTSTTASAATSGTSTATTASGAATAGTLLTLGTFLSGLGLASKLDRDLAVKNGLAVELLDSTLGL